GIKLTADEQRQLSAGQTAKPEALDAYFRGMYRYNRDEIAEAIQLGREAIRLDPRLARGHELLGLGLLRAAAINRWHYSAVSAEVRGELNRALELDPNRGGALGGLGWLVLVSEHDWDKSGPLLRRGFELDAENDFYADWLSGQMRFDESIEVIR